MLFLFFFAGRVSGCDLLGSSDFGRVHGLNLGSSRYEFELSFEPCNLIGTNTLGLTGFVGIASYVALNSAAVYGYSGTATLALI